MNDDCCYKLYMHVNKVNGKVYIGQTKQSYRVRWNNGKGYGYRSRFAKAIEKYGWDDGFEHIPLIEGLTKSEADYFERFFIEFFDSQNPEFGYNLTAGGDICPLDDPVVRAKYDEAMKKVYTNPEWRENQYVGAKKRTTNPEYQKKNREALKKMHADPEWLKNVREGVKKRSANPEWLKNVRGGAKKRCADPEWQKNHHEAMKKLSADPEWRKNVSEANRKKAQDPEWQENQRVGAKKRSADPEWQENQRVGAKKRSADPEWRKNVNEANQKRCKKVLCVETKIVYDSLTEAAIAVNLKTSTPICMCCGGKYKTAGGYHWEYA